MILDLFCGAGGAAMGYHRAFPVAEIVGVDINPQPRYPFTFVQADAMTYPLDGFDFIHASPPCQSYSAMSACRPGLADSYPDLLDATRGRLTASGVPWAIENVATAPLAGADDLFGTYGVTLCGRMFGLRLYRHRRFETSFSVTQPDCSHVTPASKAGHWRPGTIISVSGNCSPIAIARAAMGIDWMNRDELSESIPPAYTEHIGHALAAHLMERAA
jgi:DNA (cytosine-5)-methyltransferase 1